MMVPEEVAAEVVAGAAVVWWARGWRRRVVDDVRVHPRPVSASSGAGAEWKEKWEGMGSGS